MATVKDPYGTGADPLEVMRRALAASQAAGTAGPTGTTQSTPTTTYAQENPRTGSWSGDSPTPTNTSAYGGYDMGALRRQADALGRAADLANGNVSVESRTTQPAGSQYLPGSEPKTFTPPSIPPQSIPQQIATSGSLGVTKPTGTGALTGSLAGTGNTSGQSNPSTTTTDTNTPNALNRAYTDYQNAGAGAGAGTGDALARAAGAGAGPSGAGSGVIDQGSGAGGLGALTNSIMTQLQGIGQSAIAPGSSPDVSAVFMNQANAILKMLDEQEAQLRAENAQQGTQIDPATQFTIDRMREGLNESLKATREDLSRRGLNESGILIEAEQMLRKGSLSDQGRVLAERLTGLQNQLSQGLAGIRGRKADTMQSFGSQAANAQFTSGENNKRNALDREQSQLQGMLNLRGQQSSENQASLNRSFQGNESALQRAFNAEQAELDRQYGDAQNRAQSAAQFEANRQKYEQESALIAQRNAGGSSGGGGGSARATSAARTTQAAQGRGDVTADAIADLKSVFTNANEATAAIKQQMNELAAAGVDIAALYNAADGLGRRRVGTSDY
jgi:hypothetical protein